MFGFTDKNEYDELANCLIRLSLANNTSFDMIHYFIDDEFRTNTNTSTTNSIMRENCIASKIVKAYLGTHKHLKFLD
jgi:hypothetical protein